jgi:hypothetical protein
VRDVVRNEVGELGVFHVLRLLGVDVVNARSGLLRVAGVVSDDDDDWEEQLGDEVSEPERGWLRQADSMETSRPTPARNTPSASR